MVNTATAAVNYVFVTLTTFMAAIFRTIFVPSVHFRCTLGRRVCRGESADCLGDCKRANILEKKLPSEEFSAALRLREPAWYSCYFSYLSVIRLNFAIPIGVRGEITGSIGTWRANKR